METQTIEQLLKFMLANPKCFSHGLCGWAYKLCYNNLITKEEKWLLLTYIRKNRPSKYSSVEAYLHREDLYFWKKDRIRPRIKWLKEHIHLHQ